MDKGTDFYAITITFAYLHNKSAVGQFWEVIPYCTKVLNSATEFQIVPEWRITNGSIHVHGVIQIKDKIKWFMSTLPAIKRMGYCLIKKIDNMSKWTEYYKKEMSIAQTLVPIIRQPIRTVIKKQKIKTKYEDKTVYEQMFDDATVETSQSNALAVTLDAERGESVDLLTSHSMEPHGDILKSK